MGIPKHIRYLSIIFFLNAVGAGLIGALSLFSMFYSSFNTEDNVNVLPNRISAIFSHFGLSILMTVIAIGLLIFLGINLRKLKPWARKITLIYSLLSIFLFLLNLLTGDLNFSIGVFVQLYAIWVLSRSDVKEAFGVKIENQP